MMQESDEQRLRRQDQEKIDHVTSFLIHDFSIPRSDLMIDRTSYKEIPHNTTNYQDMLRRGKEKVNYHGLKPVKVKGRGNESLYRAVCRGLMEKKKEDDYIEIYNTGILKMGKDPEKDGLGFTMNPRDVLDAVAKVYSVRIIVFNANEKKRVTIHFSPPAETYIERTVSVLCVPSIDLIKQAYALESLAPVFRDDQAEPSSKEDHIFRQHTMPVPFKPSLDEAAAIDRLKTSIPFFSDMRCLYNEDEDAQGRHD